MMKDTTFPARLRELRERAGLTQSELARRAGLKSQHVCMMESGRRPNPNWQTVTALARVLGVTLEEFR